MLVLTRKLNESIQLGDDITITVVAVESDRVRIGIDAPRSLKIYRKELLDEIKRMNQEAADAPMVSLKSLGSQPVDGKLKRTKEADEATSIKKNPK